MLRFGATVSKRFALCYRSLVCLSVLSVVPVCLWRWCIVAKRLDRSTWNWHGGRLRPLPHCVRWMGTRDPALLSQRGTTPCNFRPCLLWPNRWLDQDATWYGGI